MSEKWLKNKVFQDVKATAFGYMAVGESENSDDKANDPNGTLDWDDDDDETDV